MGQARKYQCPAREGRPGDAQERADHGMAEPRAKTAREEKEMISDRSDTVRAVMRWILAAFYSAAGVAHLWVPDKLLAITPSWVPFAPQVIFITGLFELAGSVALVTKPLRWWAGLAMAIYALCVWPANIKHAVDGIELPYITNSWLYHGP